MNGNVVIGIDPGLEGAAALLGAGWARVIDLPVKEDETFGKRINCAALAAKLQEQIPLDARVQVCIEALANGGFGGGDKAKSRTNAATVGSQFWTQSALVNTLELLGLQVDCAVAVPTWKKLYGLGGKKDADAALTKRRVRQLVAELYPDLADHVQMQKHHNRAEAVLIAHWFRKVRA